MFAYCGNNPVRRIDIAGTSWLDDAWGWFSETTEAIADFFGEIFGVEVSSSVTLFESETPIVPDPSPITVTQGQYTEEQITQQGDSSKLLSAYAHIDASDPVFSSTIGGKVNILSATADLSLGFQDTSLTISSSNQNYSSGFSLKANICELKIGVETWSSQSRGNTSHTYYTNVSISGWVIFAIAAYYLTGQPAPAPT